MARYRDLSRDGYFGLLISSLGICDLGRLGLDLREATDALNDLFVAFSDSPKPKEAARAVFVRGQNSLMAFQRDDFVTIQDEPVFNDRAIEEINSYLDAWSSGGRDELMRQYELSLALLYKGQKDLAAQPPIRILGGDGSKADPVRFTAGDLRKRVRAENWWMNYEFGQFCEDWDEVSHMTTFTDDLSGQLSLWNIEMKDGSPRKIYFDTTLFGETAS